MLRQYLRLGPKEEVHIIAVEDVFKEFPNRSVSQSMAGIVCWGVLVVQLWIEKYIALNQCQENNIIRRTLVELKSSKPNYLWSYDLWLITSTLFEIHLCTWPRVVVLFGLFFLTLPQPRVPLMKSFPPSRSATITASCTGIDVYLLAKLPVYPISLLW